MKRYLVMVVLASISLSSLIGAAPANAAPRERCFPETGYCITGAILEYWERNGGLPVFGYPTWICRCSMPMGLKAACRSSIRAH